MIYNNLWISDTIIRWSKLKTDLASARKHIMTGKTGKCIRIPKQTKITAFLCTKMHNFPQNSKNISSDTTIPSKELSKFPIFPSMSISLLNLTQFPNNEQFCFQKNSNSPTVIQVGHLQNQELSQKSTPAHLHQYIG